MQGWLQSLHLFGPARQEKEYKMEHLRELYAFLTRNLVVTEANRAAVVETVREISEYMIYGDQNDAKMFDFFLEHNPMTCLQRILEQPANRHGEMAKQVLQTLGIIFQNVRSQQGIYYLFSNNHINAIIDLDYGLDDDEVLALYVTLLKNISLKLNASTVQFFFDTSGKRRQQQQQS